MQINEIKIIVIINSIKFSFNRDEIIFLNKKSTNKKKQKTIKIIKAIMIKIR